MRKKLTFRKETLLALRTRALPIALVTGAIAMLGGCNLTTLLGGGTTSI